MSKESMMRKFPKLGEVIVPGPSRNSGVRSFMLTDTKNADTGAEMLFGLLSAQAPKKVVDKLVDHIIDDIRPTFFSSNEGAEARYESSLKQVNRSILAFLHEHHLSLPGIKLRGFMVALSGDTLFVTNRGGVRGLLVMKKHEKSVIVPIFSEESDTSTNPKFFSSFQQGTIPPDTVFVAGTREVFMSVDEPFLKRVFTKKDPSCAGRELRRGLGNKPNIALLTLAIPSDIPQKFEISASEKIPKPLNTQQQRKTDNAKLPVFMDIGEIGAKSIEGIFVFLLSHLKRVPRAMLAILRGFATILRILAHAPKVVRSLADATHRKTISDEVKRAPKRLMQGGLLRFNALTNRQKAHLLLLIVISAIFIHGTLYSLHKHSQALVTKSYETKLAEISQLQTDLETSIIIGNDRRSHDVAGRLGALIEELPEKNQSEIKTKKELFEDFRAQNDKLKRYVTITDPEILANFEDTEGRFKNGPFTWFGKALYLFSPSGTAVKSFMLDGSSSEEPLNSPSRIRAITPARTGILLALTDGSIGFWKPGAPDVIIYPDISVTQSPILFYQGRLYHITENGMIERRQILNGKLGRATNVLQVPSGVTNPASLAADGAAYLLSNNGQIHKYLKGRAVDGFQSPVIDPPPKRPKNLWANANSRWLVFLEQAENRIVMIDSATGRLAAQLVSPAFGNISSMTVDNNGDFAYLHSGTRIISVPLKGPGIR